MNFTPGKKVILMPRILKGKLSWEEFERICKEAGGEPSPIPPSWYNVWEKIYEDEPLFIAETDEGIGYCCKPVKGDRK